MKVLSNNAIYIFNFSFTMKIHNSIPCAITVAGSDSGGGAGIQADLLTFAANGVWATSAIAALTAQNPEKVTDINVAGGRFLLNQLEAIYTYYTPRAAKTGMLFDTDTISAAVNFFETHPDIKLVVDPVAISTSGAKLLKDDAIDILKKRLLPLATVFTPNLDEAAMLLNCDKIEHLPSAAKELEYLYKAPVFLKGGHLESNKITDTLCINSEIIEMTSTRIEGIDTHGSGCTLSAAITANLAKGESLVDACANARNYLLQGMMNPVAFKGKKFINHFPNAKK